MTTISEMIAVVQMYIHHRKDVEVQIAIEHPSDIPKLIKAYNIALEWLQNNNFKCRTI